MGGGQLAECGVRAIFGRFVFHDVAGGHILEHLIGVPSSLDDEIAVVLEPSDKGFGFLADLFADTFDNGFVVGGGDDFQSFYGHKGYPSVGVFFHCVTGLKLQR